MVRQPTLLDIANHVGVSTFAASRALAGKPGVSTETRERVVTAARELGYVANAVAANLKGGRSSTVGVMTASGRNQYYATLVQGIDAVLQRNGLHLVTNDAMRGGRYDGERQRQSVEALLQQRVAAIVATYPLSETSLDLIRQWQTPLLFVDALPPSGAGSCPFVGCDNLEAGRLVANYLSSLGCRRVTILAYPKEWNTRAPREQGFRDSAHSTMTIEVVESDNSAESAFDAMVRHLRGTQRPDAIYALNTPLLQGAMRALNAAGLRIPDDISVLGFDDFEWAPLLDPPMTVVDQHIDEIGRLAGTAIVDLLASPSTSTVSPAAPPAYIAVPPTLVIRGSCRQISAGRESPPSL